MTLRPRDDVAIGSGDRPHREPGAASGGYPANGTAAENVTLILLPLGASLSICGERIARVTLELGGKSAAVVLDDFDIAKAASSIVGPACLMTGQVCSSLTRIVVSRNRHDELVEALSESFSHVQVGDPFDAATQMGPLAIQLRLNR